jgi:LysM repeat protein
VDLPRAPQTPLAGGQRGLAGQGSGRRRDEFDDDFDEDLDSRDGWRDSSRQGQAPPTATDRIRSAFGVGSDRRPSVGDTRARGAVDAPVGRQPPRRNDAHPTNRTRLGTPAVSRLAVIALALVIAAIALYFLPELLMGGDRDDNGGLGGAPSASAPAAVASASVEPSVSAAPTQQVYVVQEGDTLEKIRQQFGLTLAELRAANPQITNPDRIAIGDEIIIPQGDPAESEGASPDTEASAGASP